MNDDLDTTDAALTAFEQAPAMLWQCEGDPLVVTACNALARARFGESAGDGVREVFGSGAAPSLADRLEQVVATGETLTLHDHLLADGGDGEADVFADVVARPCFDRDGAVSGVATMAVDTTEAVLVRRREADRVAARPARDEHPVLTTLHDAILPEGLPVVPGAAVAARYLLAQHEAGGDWFDLVVLDDGRMVLVVGDVVGHGVAASVMMSELRAVFNERVRADGDIVAALELLDRRASRTPATRAATVCAVLLDPESGLVRYATAGHPPPLTVRADEGATYLPATGGAALGTGRPFPVLEHRLVDGELLLLYTDGLVDPLGPSAQGTVELARLASELLVLETARDDETPLVQRVCTRLLEQATRSGFADDVVLLALHRAPAGPALHLSLDDDPASLPVVRRELGRWLTPLGISGLDEMVLQHAVGELVANAVEHAYAGSSDPGEPGGHADGVVLEAHHCAGGVVEIEVRDHGEWREPVAAPDRGRGLAMVVGFCDELDIEHGSPEAPGTRARLRHRPAPVGRPARGVGALARGERRPDGAPARRRRAGRDRAGRRRGRRPAAPGARDRHPRRHPAAAARPHRCDPAEQRRCADDLRRGPARPGAAGPGAGRVAGAARAPPGAAALLDRLSSRGRDSCRPEVAGTYGRRTQPPRRCRRADARVDREAGPAGPAGPEESR